MYDIVITSLPGMDKDKPAPGPAFLKGFLEPFLVFIAVLLTEVLKIIPLVTTTFVLGLRNKFRPFYCNSQMKLLFF